MSGSINILPPEFLDYLPILKKKLRSEKARPENRMRSGIHFVRYGAYCVRYNAQLLKDYVATRSDPEAHKRAIASYLASLPSNQPKRVGRKTKTSIGTA